jgi:hypothetical protein
VINRIVLTSTNSSASGSLSDDDDATVAFTHQVHVSWQPCVLLVPPFSVCVWLRWEGEGGGGGGIVVKWFG